MDLERIVARIGGAFVTEQERKPLLSDCLRDVAFYVYTFERDAAVSARGGTLLGDAPPVPEIPSELAKIKGFRIVRDAGEEVRRERSSWHLKAMFGGPEARKKVALVAEVAAVSFRTTVLTRRLPVGMFRSLGYEETLRVINDARSGLQFGSSDPPLDQAYPEPGCSHD